MTFPKVAQNAQKLEYFKMLYFCIDATNVWGYLLTWILIKLTVNSFNKFVIMRISLTDGSNGYTINSTVPYSSSHFQ